MPQLTPQQMKKARKALELIQEGGTKKDLVIMDMVVELEDKVENALEEIKTVASNVKSVSENEAEMANKMTKNILKDIKGKDGYTPVKGKDYFDGENGKNYVLTNRDKQEIAQSIKVPVVDKIIEKHTETIVKEQPIVKEIVKEVIVDETKIVDIIEKDLPTLGFAIRDSLELIQKEEDKLDISAIKGIDKSQTTLSDSIINRAIGIVDQRTSFLINKLSNLSDTVSRLPSSTTQTIVEKIGFTVDGGGSAITTGKAKGFTVASYTGTITAWNIVVDAGTATVKVWKIASGTAKPTSANSINTSGVAISTGTAVRSTTLTDFTSTAVTAGDIFGFNIEAVATATEMSFILEISS